MKIFTRLTLSTKKLAIQFGYTLIPLAFVYHLAHYYTLFIVQGQDIIRLISDPFGRGWNLFGTATFKPNIALLGAKFIWHSQVALIVFGHMVAVYLAHILAIHIFKSSKKAFISQIPMLFLMVFYTMMGLWILAQPLSGKSLTNEIQQEKQLPPPDNPENFFIRHPAMPIPPISPK